MAQELNLQKKTGGTVPFEKSGFFLWFCQETLLKKEDARLPLRYRVFLTNIYNQIARLRDPEDRSPEQVMKCKHNFTILDFTSPIQFFRNLRAFL